MNNDSKTNKCNLFSLNNIYKSFNNNIILNGLRYDFLSSKSYALVGPSGTGKSTLIYLMANLDQPDSGSILLNKANIYKFTDSQIQKYLNKSIGLIFQQPCLIPELTVIENVLIKSFIYNDITCKSKYYAETLLRNVNMIDKANKLPSSLSGGEQQRVAIARALLYQPLFLLADEPTAHLDYKNKDIILELLLNIKQQNNMGLIMSTHDLTVAKLLDHTLTLSKGNIQVKD